MRYQNSYYTDVAGNICRCILGSLLSFQFAFAVILTGLFAAKMLQVLGATQHMQDVIFLSCACFFLWSFCMSAIEMNIKRDVL